MFNDYQFQTYAFNTYQWPEVITGIPADGASCVLATYVSGSLGWGTYVGGAFKQATKVSGVIAEVTV